MQNMQPTQPVQPIQPGSSSSSSSSEQIQLSPISESLSKNFSTVDEISTMLKTKKVNDEASFRTLGENITKLDSTVTCLQTVFTQSINQSKKAEDELATLRLEMAQQRQIHEAEIKKLNDSLNSGQLAQQIIDCKLELINSQNDFDKKNKEHLITVDEQKEAVSIRLKEVKNAKSAEFKKGAEDDLRRAEERQKEHNESWEKTVKEFHEKSLMLKEKIKSFETRITKINPNGLSDVFRITQIQMQSFWNVRENAIIDKKEKLVEKMQMVINAHKLAHAQSDKCETHKSKSKGLFSKTISDEDFQQFSKELVEFETKHQSDEKLIAEAHALLEEYRQLLKDKKSELEKDAKALDEFYKSEKRSITLGQEEINKKEGEVRGTFGLDKTYDTYVKATKGHKKDASKIEDLTKAKAKMKVVYTPENSRLDPDQPYPSCFKGSNYDSKHDAKSPVRTV